MSRYKAFAAAVAIALCIVAIASPPGHGQDLTTDLAIFLRSFRNGIIPSATFCVDSTNQDTCLTRGSGAGFMRLYSTSNSTSNYFAVKNGAVAEFGGVGWDGSNSLLVGTQGGVNGGTARNTIVGSASTLYLASNNGTSQFGVNTNGDLTNGSSTTAVIINRATPTLVAGSFSSGTAATIAGIASSFAVTVGTTPTTTGTINYVRAFGAAPSCQCTNTITANAVQCVPTTTQAVLNGVWVASDVIRCTSLGY